MSCSGDAGISTYFLFLRSINHFVAYSNFLNSQLIEASSLSALLISSSLQKHSSSNIHSALISLIFTTQFIIRTFLPPSPSFSSLHFLTFSLSSLSLPYFINHHHCSHHHHHHHHLYVLHHHHLYVLHHHHLDHHLHRQWVVSR